MSTYTPRHRKFYFANKNEINEKAKEYRRLVYYPAHRAEISAYNIAWKKKRTEERARLKIEQKLKQEVIPKNE